MVKRNLNKTTAEILLNSNSHIQTQLTLFKYIQRKKKKHSLYARLLPRFKWPHPDGKVCKSERAPYSQR